MLIKEKLRFVSRWACQPAPAQPPPDRHIIPCARCQEIDKAAFEIQVRSAILLVVGYVAMAVIVWVLILNR
jgi:hypothetical protein